MKMVFNAGCYLVLCRDTKGAVFALHGNRKDGVYAKRILREEMLGVEQFNVPHDHAMDRREFVNLHKALLADTPVKVWYGSDQDVDVELVKDSVFYRRLELRTVPVDLVEPHRAPQPKATPQFYRITGATCHYRSTTITLVGQSTGSDLGCESFTHQIYREAAKHGWNIEHHSVTGVRRTKTGVECTVQFTFELGTAISRVRKHMLAAFPAAPVLESTMSA